MQIGWNMNANDCRIFPEYSIAIQLHEMQLQRYSHDALTFPAYNDAYKSQNDDDSYLKLAYNYECW